MTDDRSLERAARSWLEEGPSKAPDRPVDAALARIQTTRQERDWIPWRLPTMNPIARLAMVAVVAAIAIGGLLYAFGGINGQFGDTPTPVPSPTAPVAILDGTYLLDLPVDDILAALDADKRLSVSQKDAVIDDVLAVRGAETLNLRIVIAEGKFTLHQGTDGSPMDANPPWAMTAIDGHTVAFGNVPTTGTARYEVVPGSTAGSFTLRPLSAAGSVVEDFVRATLFATAPFVPTSSP
jgi:hypothetical protein